MIRTVRCALLGAGFAAIAWAAPAAAQTACDRQCLEGMVDTYLDAMVAHDTSKAPLAQATRFTENGQEMPIGGALWRTASKRGAYRVVVSDPEHGQVGFLGTIYENGTPAILGLRLRIEGGKITEAEHVVGRSKEAATKLDAMKPAPALASPAPAADRLPAAELRRIADLYFAGIEGGNTSVDTPFTADCVRLENGNRTTNNPELAAKARASGRFSYLDLGCKAQFETGYFKIVSEVRERRFPVIDVERQTVFSFVFFDHTGDVRQVKLTDGTVAPVGLSTPFTWEMAELFRIEKGKIHLVEAVLNSAPYRMKSGWPADAPLGAR